MKKNTYLTDIWDAIVRDSACLVYIGSKRCLYIQKGDEIMLLSANRFSSLHKVDDEIWCLDQTLRKTLIYNLITEEQTYLSLIATPIKKINENIFRINENEIRFFGEIDLKTKIIIKNYPARYGLNGIWEILDNKTFLSQEDNILTCHTLADGAELWRIDFTEQAKWTNSKGEPQRGSLYGHIEVFEGKAVVQLTNYKLIVIDLATGQTVWERQMPTRILTPAAFGNGKIYWLSLGDEPQYFIIDIPTGNIETSLVPSPELKERLVFSQPIVSGNDLLMTSVSTHEIFVLDKETSAVKSITKIEGCRNRIPIDNSPQKQGNRIYQLDGDETLHIFEVEES